MSPRQDLVSDVRPPRAMDYREDARFTDAEFESELSVCDATGLIAAPNFDHVLFGQYRDVLSSGAFRALLKSSRVSMMHLLAHRGQLKIGTAVVAFVAVLVVHGHAARDRSNEMFIDQSVNQSLVRIATTVTPTQSNAEVAAIRWSERNQSRHPTPEPFHASDITGVADFVETFVAVNGCPNHV
jgi:hypothetical protein